MISELSQWNVERIPHITNFKSHLQISKPPFRWGFCDDALLLSRLDALMCRTEYALSVTGLS